ncbi:hypothetical protein PV762_22375 [Mitsuaria sp. CC2]|uniref:hypothetical protein n=1 Tax=Mitsuaria sp. CC2 TaxID=3029186 RepID=UPI003B8B5E64
MKFLQIALGVREEGLAFEAEYPDSTSESTRRVCQQNADSSLIFDRSPSTAMQARRA